MSPEGRFIPHKDPAHRGSRTVVDGTVVSSAVDPVVYSVCILLSPGFLPKNDLPVRKCCSERNLRVLQRR